MAAIALALASALSWGSADFLGGLKSRQLPLLAVMFVSQLAGLLAVLVFIAATRPASPNPEVLWAALGGAGGVIALTAFYHALSIGTMSIVAPISATGAALPVIVGVATGDRPSAVQAVGIVVAVVGVVLASREISDNAEEAQAARRSVGLAVIAALGFGSFLIAMDAASEHSVSWALLSARSTSVLVLLVITLAVRAPRRVPRRDVPSVAAVGGLDLGANALYGVASTKGLLSVVSVCGSLYPVTTIILARLLLGERVRRIQEAGIAAALVGVALIAAG
jgi:drug/metabolite transporter (DMT)-like permease